MDLITLHGNDHLKTFITKFTVKEVKNAIQKIDPKKAPGYDLITGKLLRELPEAGVKFLTFTYNAILWRSYVPPQ